MTWAKQGEGQSFRLLLPCSVGLRKGTRHPKPMAGHCDPSAASACVCPVCHLNQMHSDPRCFLHTFTCHCCCGREVEEVPPSTKSFLQPKITPGGQASPSSGLLLWFWCTLHPTTPQLSPPCPAFVTHTMRQNLPLQAAGGQKLSICGEFIWHLSSRGRTELINAVTTSLGAIKFILWLN